MSIVSNGVEVLKEYIADGLIWRVLKENRIKYPSIRHASAELNGKPNNKYITQELDARNGREYSYVYRPYREALEWFKDKIHGL